MMVTLKVKLKRNWVANNQTWYLLCEVSLCFHVTLVSFFVNTSKVIDMVKDEMVKQGKSRGTGRPGKVAQIVETKCCFFLSDSSCYTVATASKAPSHQLGPMLVGLYYHLYNKLSYACILMGSHL